MDSRIDRTSTSSQDLGRFRRGNGPVSRADVYEVQPDIDSGPVISPQAKERIEAVIGSVESQGGKILLDGRGCKVAEYPDGNFVGPTIVEVTTDMDAYK